MIDKDAELQARISALAGQINQRKQQQHPSAPPIRDHGPRAIRGHARWSPYGRGGRGGRAGFRQPHMNRTLVLNGTPSTSSPASEPITSKDENTTIPVATPDAFIATRKPGMKQLMNKETYDREQKQKSEHQEHTRAVKNQKVDRDERSRLNQYTSAQDNRVITVEGIRFRLREDGSKLIRVVGGSAPTLENGHLYGLLNIPDDNTTRETPRTVKVADVGFFRTKNGNLVRANAVKEAKRYFLARDSNGTGRDSHHRNHRPLHRKQTVQCEHFTKNGTQIPKHYRLDLRHPTTDSQRYPPAGKFKSSLTRPPGNCPHGPMCHFAHDPNKVAICPLLLRSNCTRGDDCDLSHTPTYSNTPACTHFLRGNCTNDACRYPHIHVSPTAPVCAPFARLGYCDAQSCEKRHVFECPDYANTGHCAKAARGRCPLPHPDRAATMRKAAAKKAKLSSEDVSDLSSDEENQEDQAIVEDIDSDDVEDVVMGDDQSYGHELTQQQDFIRFS